jgi:KDO2-lipid IV(A) lauroyltransferase
VRTRKKLKRKGEYWLVRSIEGLARALPRRAGHRVFGAVGALAGRLLARDRHRAVANLGIAFPEAPEMVRRAIAAAMFRNLGRNAYEFLNLESSTPAELDARVDRVEGMDEFQRAFGLGRGVIVITGHIGCWEMMPAYFASRGYPLAVVGRRMKVDRLNDRLIRIRSSVGVTTIDRNSSPRRLIEVLRRGHLLGVLIDQHTRVAGMYVPFFGRPAFTPTAVAKLSLMTGAPILPMGIYLGGNGRHVVHVLPTITPGTAAGDRDLQIRDLTERASLAVEDLIRIDPKQWVWFHHRWREPEGEGRAYAVQG